MRLKRVEAAYCKTKTTLVFHLSISISFYFSFWQLPSIYEVYRSYLRLNPYKLYYINSMIKTILKTYLLYPSLSLKCIYSFNTSQNLFELFQLPTTASEIQIKKRYYELAKKYHPDHNKGTEMQFKAINEAYQILSNTQLKNQYLKDLTQSKIYQTKTHSTQKVNINNQQKRDGDRPLERVYRRVYYQDENWRLYQYHFRAVGRRDVLRALKEEQLQKKLYEQGRLRNAKRRRVDLATQIFFFVFLMSVLLAIPTIIKYSKDRQIKNSYQLNMTARANYPYKKIKESEKRKQKGLTDSNDG